MSSSLTSEMKNTIPLNIILFVYRIAKCCNKHCHLLSAFIDSNNNTLVFLLISSWKMLVLDVSTFLPAETQVSHPAGCLLMKHEIVLPVTSIFRISLHCEVSERKKKCYRTVEVLIIKLTD